MKVVKLPSGATLKITPSPFETSLALYEAICLEMKDVRISTDTEMADFIKTLWCMIASSRTIKACLWECFKRCTYNSGSGDLRIDMDTFQPEAARPDYQMVCMEVVQSEVSPFGKEAFVRFATYVTELANSLRPK